MHVATDPPERKALKRAAAQARYIGGYEAAARDARQAAREHPESLELALAAQRADRELDKARRICGQA
jgi:hypothetical protein